MYYDQQIIYGQDDKTSFTWNGWVYYRTKSGKPKRHNDNGQRESLNENQFNDVKNVYEQTIGVKLNV